VSGVPGVGTGRGQTQSLPSHAEVSGLRTFCAKASWSSRLFAATEYKIQVPLEEGLYRKGLPSMRSIGTLASNPGTQGLQGCRRFPVTELIPLQADGRRQHAAEGEVLY